MYKKGNKLRKFGKYLIIISIMMIIYIGMAIAASVAPNSGAPGTQVVAIGNGWTPGDKMHIQWEMDTAGKVVDSNGGFSITLLVPLDATIGLHQLYVTDEQQSRTFWIMDFTVTQPTGPTITVAFPNGGETLVRGTGRNIMWDSTGNPGSNVRIDLLKNGVVVGTVTPSTPNDGIQLWGISSTRALGSDYKIRVSSTSNPTITDTSNNNFIIGGINVHVPNGGENWARGTTHTITWSKLGYAPGANVKIELLKNGKLVGTVTSSTPNDGSYPWTISSTRAIGADYKIRVTSTTDPTYTDVSNNNFVITEPYIYAAIAFSPSLKALREGFGATATDAQAVALNACLRYASTQTEYYNDCAPWAWVRNGWISFSSSGRASRELDWAWGNGWGHTQSEAMTLSIDTCRKMEDVPRLEFGFSSHCLQVGSFRSPVYDSRQSSSGGPHSVSWDTAPLPPTDLKVVAINKSTIRLTWRPVSWYVYSGRLNFEISNGDESRLVPAWANTYDWTTTSGSYMCLRIRATNSFGNSWWEPNVSPWYRCTTTPLN